MSCALTRRRWRRLRLRQKQNGSLLWRGQQPCWTRPLLARQLLAMMVMAMMIKRVFSAEPAEPAVESAEPDKPDAAESAPDKPATARAKPAAKLLKSKAKPKPVNAKSKAAVTKKVQGKKQRRLKTATHEESVPSSLDYHACFWPSQGSPEGKSQVHSQVCPLAPTCGRFANGLQTSPQWSSRCSQWASSRCFEMSPPQKSFRRQAFCWKLTCRFFLGSSP